MTRALSRRRFRADPYPTSAMCCSGKNLGEAFGYHRE